MAETRRCPHCKQPLPSPARPARICSRCDSPIDRHMKWHFVRRGGKTLIEHRYCDNPFEYGPRTEK